MTRTVQVEMSFVCLFYGGTAVGEGLPGWGGDRAARSGVARRRRVLWAIVVPRCSVVCTPTGPSSG